MNPIAILLVVLGIAAIAVGALRIRGPLATIRRLDETAADIERYDTWRGHSTDIQADRPTGADEMRAFMRQRVLLWGGLIVVGVIAIVAGFIAR